jgi:uncharacterized membrane protein YgdD (TMEM256/DUF423 family)
MRFPFAFFGSILGALGVLTGAFGAHALNGILSERETRSIWETAVLFHLLHAVTVPTLGWSSGPVTWKSLSGLASIAWIRGCSSVFRLPLYSRNRGSPVLRTGHTSGWPAPADWMGTRHSARNAAKEGGALPDGHPRKFLFETPPGVMRNLGLA